MPLPRRAGNALNKMVNKGIGERPCMFIAHSLGGLLVKTILRQANDAEEFSDERRLIKNCRAVLFLATPHQGSSLASLYSCLSICFPSITIKELKANDANLENLHQWYQNIVPLHRIQTRSFAENKPTKNLNILVVPHTSANPGIPAPHGKNTVCLDVDHLEISRPKGPDDDVVLEARKLIKDQLDNDQLPLNPQVLKSDLFDSSIPDPFSRADFHLKVFLKATHTSEMGLLGQGYLSCTVFFLLCQGQEVLKKSEVSEGPIVFSCDNPEPLIKHLEDLQGKTLDDCGERLGNRLAPLPLHLHLKLPYTWLSGALPERIQQALKCHVFFGCSNRSAIAKSAVTQLRDQAMQVNQRLHSGSGLSSLLWATVCHQGVGQAEFEQLFAPIPDVIHLNSPILDDEHAHSDLVGRDALLSTEPRLLFPERFSTAGNRQGEATGVRRWRRLVVIGLPLVLWWRADGTEPKSTNLDHLPRILQSSWQEFCGHLELIAQMVNSQEPEKLTMKALMTNIGIFYEDPLRNSPQDQDPYRHPVHAPT
jgi:hypothetical protein